MFGAVALIGLVQIGILLHYRIRGQRVIGRVARVNRHEDEESASYTADVEYKVGDRRFVVSTSVGTFPAFYREGELVPVYYVLERPEKGKIVTLREVTVWLIFVLCGLGIITWVSIAAAMV